MSAMMELQRQINDLQRDVERLKRVEKIRHPGARIYRNAAQSIPNDTFTTLAFNSERYDTDDFHDTAVNNSRLTIPVSGRYLIAATLMFDASAVGYRQAGVFINGSLIISLVTLPATGGGIQTNLNVVGIGNLAAGEYAEIGVRQNSGAALNVASAANYTPEVVIIYLGGLAA